MLLGGGLIFRNFYEHNQVNNNKPLPPSLPQANNNNNNINQPPPASPTKQPLITPLPSSTKSPASPPPPASSSMKSTTTPVAAAAVADDVQASLAAQTARATLLEKQIDLLAKENQALLQTTSQLKEEVQYLSALDGRFEDTQDEHHQHIALT
jgi:hypothetical protein